MSKNIDFVRKKILHTAKRLIIEQGYRKTTIRQIVQASGIASGSIYHLFPNKDKIFWALVQEILENVIRIVKRDFASESAQFRYAAILEVELCAIEHSPAIQEIYYESYAQPETFELVVDRAVALQREMLPPEALEALDAERPLQTLMLKGAMYGYIMSFSFEQAIDPAQARKAIVAMALRLLGIDEHASGYLAKRMETMQAHWYDIAQTVLSDAFDEEVAEGGEELPQERWSLS